MVQKSGVYQSRSVCYPHYLQGGNLSGFLAPPKPVRWPLTTRNIPDIPPFPIRLTKWRINRINRCDIEKNTCSVLWRCWGKRTKQTWIFISRGVFFFLKCKLFLVLCMKHPRFDMIFVHTATPATQPKSWTTNLFYNKHGIIFCFFKEKEWTKNTPKKTNMTMEKPPFEDVLHREHGGFSNTSHVSFQGSNLQKHWCLFSSWSLWIFTWSPEDEGHPEMAGKKRTEVEPFFSSGTRFFRGFWCFSFIGI